MTEYKKEFCDLIMSGLERVSVTEKSGRELVVDEGLDIFADRVNGLQQYTKGLIFFCGNGASATMAEHMSHDWFQNAQINTCTCSETSHITAISNDVGYEDVFSYRVERILSEHDILVGISSSGNSPNIVKAVQAAGEKGAFVVTVSGRSANNRIRQMGDLNFYVPLEHYGEIESAHGVLLHCMLDYYLDRYMGGRH